MGLLGVTQLVKNPPAVQRPGSIPGSGSSPGGKNRLPTPVFLGFPGGSAGKEFACNNNALSEAGLSA